MILGISLAITNSNGNGSSSAPDANSFAQNGATYPLYGNLTPPPGAYDSETNCTWMCWEGASGSDKFIYVTVYNHATLEWSQAYVAGVRTIAGDSHGVPSICRDAVGHWHIFYGAHSGVMRHASTIYPDDPSRWNDNASVGTGQYTYPHPILVGSDLHLFMRRSDGIYATNMVLTLFKSTAIADGAVTWGAEATIADYGPDSRFYLGNAILVGAKIHLCSTRADAANNFRRDVHYLVYDTVNGDVETVDGLVSTPVPLNRITLDALYRIVTQPTPTGTGDIPSMCIDAAGASHVIYKDGPGPIPASSDVYHIAYSSGVWSSPYHLGTSYTTDSASCLTKASGGDIEAYWTQQVGTPSWWVPPAGFRDGGDLWRARRSAAGVWGASALLQAATTAALSEPGTIFNGHANARLMYAEIFHEEFTNSMKVFVRGDGGKIGKTSETLTYAPRLNPNDKIGVTLSNIFLTATSDRIPGAFDWNQVKAIKAIAAGRKVYFETVAALVSTTDWGVGVAVTVANGDAYFGGLLADITYNSNGDVYKGGVKQATYPAIVSGDNIGVALDRTNGKIWFRKNGGNWNNAAIGSQNPATNTGGIANVHASDPYPCLNFLGLGESAIIKLIAAEWVYGAPSGFSAL